MKQLLDYLDQNHLFHFFLTVIVLFMYFSTVINGQPSITFENMSFVVVAFWFASAGITRVNNRVSDTQDKLAALSTKVDTQENKKV